MPPCPTLLTYAYQPKAAACPSENFSAFFFLYHLGVKGREGEWGERRESESEKESEKEDKGTYRRSNMFTGLITLTLSTERDR